MKVLSSVEGTKLCDRCGHEHSYKIIKDHSQRCSAKVSMVSVKERDRIEQRKE